MLHCGADVHSKSTQLVILDGKGKELLSEKVPTDRPSLQAAVKPYAKRKLRVIQETGALQAFIQAVFGEMGVEVVTVHANHMKVITSSKKKSDRRDAFQLAWHSLKDNLPEPVYVPTPMERDLRTLLASQERVRKTRTAISNGVRGQLKAQGLTLPPNQLSRFSGWEKLLEMDLPEAARLVIVLSYEVWTAQTRALDTLAQELARRTKDDDVVRRTQTIPYVGPACSVAQRAYLGDLTRFRGRKSVVSYAGFCPSQRDSGDTRRPGHLTKEGPPRLRAVFVQAAQMLISRGFRGHEHWKPWYERLLHRKAHRHVAVVAVARRLYLLAYHVARSGEVYHPPVPLAS